MRKLLLISFFLCGNALWLMAQETINSLLLKANDNYKEGAYDKAALIYEQVLQLAPDNAIASFNYANTLYQQLKLKAAQEQYEKAYELTQNKQLRSKIAYNQGVIASGNAELETSILHYKESLRQNPANSDARNNLQKALQEQGKSKKKEEQDNQQKKQQQNEQQQQKPQPQMSKKELEKNLKLLEDKARQIQQRMQEGGQQGMQKGKDW